MPFLLFLSIFAIYGCVSNSTPTRPIQEQLIPKAGDESKSPVVDIKSSHPVESVKDDAAAVIDLQSIENGTKIKPENKGEGPCQNLELIESLPGFSSQLKVVVTRINPPCSTDIGRIGFYDDSSWMAMGFPCTAGGGKYIIRGKSYRPKMIVYGMENDCPMAPSNTSVLRERVREVKTPFLNPEKLIALTPFSLLYWESVQYPDAGVGPSIGMLSPSYLKEGWEKFRSGEILKFKLYGQENAWVSDKHFYAIEADLKSDGHRTFKLELTGVRTMTDEELSDIQKRCERLRPRRSCEALQK